MRWLKIGDRMTDYLNTLTDEQIADLEAIGRHTKGRYVLMLYDKKDKDLVLDYPTEILYTLIAEGLLRAYLKEGHNKGIIEKAYTDARDAVLITKLEGLIE